MNTLRCQKVEVDSIAIEQIVGLRKKCYLEKYQDNVNLEGLNWNREDGKAHHFAAYQENKMISCLRLSKIESAQQFESTLEFPADHKFAFIPSFSLARAATLSEFSAQSINMSLRSFVYKFIKENFTEQETYIYGTALAGSKRLTFLEQLGYEVLIHQRPWGRFLSSSGRDVAIFRLPIQKLDQAIVRLRTDSSDDHKSFKPF